MNKILNIVIHYANEEEVLSYARMLNGQSIKDRISLIVVENKKSLEPKIVLKDELQKLDMDIEVYTSNRNLGYFNGFMYGFKEYLASGKEIPFWTVLSNTDLIIDDNFAFEKLFDEKYDEKISCISPSIYNLNRKTYDNPQYKDRISLEKLLKTIFIHEHPLLSFMYLKLGKFKAKKSKQLKKDSQYCYAVHGCFIGMKYDLMEYLNKNEFKAFLFSEENYISEMVLRLGKSCFYNSNVEIVHNEKQTTKLLGFKSRAKFFEESLKFIRNEFYQ